MTSPFGAEEVPSDAELRVAQAQLVGWLEGLFHGIQATLFAQQMAARAQLEQMRQRGLPARCRRPPAPGPTCDARRTYRVRRARIRARADATSQSAPE